MLALSASIEQTGTIPTPQQLTEAIQGTKWILRPGTQARSSHFQVEFSVSEPSKNNFFSIS
jgi:hypothetical protein